MNAKTAITQFHTCMHTHTRTHTLPFSLTYTHTYTHSLSLSLSLSLSHTHSSTVRFARVIQSLQKIRQSTHIVGAKSKSLQMYTSHKSHLRGQNMQDTNQTFRVTNADNLQTVPALIFHTALAKNYSCFTCLRRLQRTSTSAMPNGIQSMYQKNESKKLKHRKAEECQDYSVLLIRLKRVSHYPLVRADWATS